VGTPFEIGNRADAALPSEKNSTRDIRSLARIKTERRCGIAVNIAKPPELVRKP
jgi:hypothetical protein